MKIYLKGEDGFQFLLPVNPEEIKVVENHNINVISVLNAGEVPLPGFDQLQKINFESFFPSKKDGNYIGSQIQDPLQLVNKLREWRRGNKAVQVTIIGLFGKAIEGGNLNRLFYIEKFELTGKYGYESDVPYSISFVEYRRLQPKKLEIKKEEPAKTVVEKPAEQAERPKETPPKKEEAKSTKKPIEHTVVRGDTLWGIARKYYGNGQRWREIFEANKDKIKDPNLIYPGQVFVIPGTEAPEGGNTKPRTYTVVRGDYLRKLAQRFYGNEMQWPKIYNANKDKIKNPDIIYPGQVLVIP